MFTLEDPKRAKGKQRVNITQKQYVMFTSITVKIISLKNKKNDDGLIPIYLQFTQNRKVNRVALRKWVAEKDWINTNGQFIKERNSNNDKKAKALNSFLRKQLERAEQLILNAQREDRYLSFHDFKKKFIELINISFYDFCEKEIARRIASKQYADATIDSNKIHNLSAAEVKNYREMNQYFFHCLVISLGGTAEYKSLFLRYFDIDDFEQHGTVARIQPFLQKLIDWDILNNEDLDRNEINRIMG